MLPEGVEDACAALGAMCYTAACIHSVEQINSVQRNQERRRMSCFVKLSFAGAGGAVHDHAAVVKLLVLLHPPAGAPTAARSLRLALCDVLKPWTPVGDASVGVVMHAKVDGTETGGYVHINRAVLLYAIASKVIILAETDAATLRKTRLGAGNLYFVPCAITSGTGAA